MREKREREYLKAEEKEANNFEANTKLFWTEVKKAGSCSATPRINSIKNKDSDIFISTEKIVKRWNEHFGDMYKSFYNFAFDTDSVSDAVTFAASQDITLQEVVCVFKVCIIENEISFLMNVEECEGNQNCRDRNI